jgi:membrane protease YdiL (CAAX protease family)
VSLFAPELVPVDPSAPKTFAQWLELPQVKWAVPIPLLIGLAPFVWLFFRGTWRELENDALERRKQFAERGDVDYRPAVALALAALILTLQDYYGGPVLYDALVHKWLVAKEAKNPQGWVSLARYEELYRLIWWAVTRMGGYLLPMVVWRMIFFRDSLLDFGLRTKGFLDHAWIYAMFVVIMIPTMRIVARQPDFGTYYPFYRGASKSWLDLVVWEAFYIGQFFCLELFFRGWWLRANRSLGLGAIFSMIVPYCMIHYGKPYLETCGAIVAGTVLGSLSMKTRSIYAGFLVHITVAILMDLLALERRNALPTLLSQTSMRSYSFHHLHLVFWCVWAVALVTLVVSAVVRRGELAQWLRQNLPGRRAPA